MQQGHIEEGHIQKGHVARHAFSAVGISLLTFVIVGGFFLSAYLMRSALQSGQMAAVISATLVDLANKDRSKNDLAPLSVNPQLVEAAQAKADDMAAKGYFAHTSPEGYEPWYWIKNAGYEYARAGENLAINFSDSEDVERAWMKSPGHRANILHQGYTEIGIATAVGEYKGERTVFVVQMFGTRREAPVAATAPERDIVTPETPEETIIITNEPEPTPLDEQTLAEALPEPTVAAAQTMPRFTSDAEALAASPSALLRTLYLLCAGIILVALFLTTRFEWQRHHMRHMLAASVLLVLMTGLFAYADWFLFTDPVVSELVATAR